MTEVSWFAFAMAALSLAGTVASAVNGRKLAWDKAEAERLAGRDKMEFDHKAAMLSLQVEYLKAQVAECHRDRNEQRAQLTALEITCGQQQTEIDTLKKRADIQASLNAAPSPGPVA
jgi:outer membrane murein-binding lipoprotein Lpp